MMAEEQNLSQISPKTSVISRLWKNFERVNSLIYAAGAIAIFLLAAITILDVGGRYLFNRTLPGALELSELTMCTIIFMCFGYSITLKTHVSVDVITIMLPKRVKALLGIMTNILTLFFLTVLVSQSVRIAIEQRGNYTDILKIPTFIFTLLVPIGSTIAAISLIGHLAEDILSIIQDKGDSK
ncbi:MAG: TRAP transporter small permease [Deltaproteobacteria bacterium]|nr:TRAP transporter small permease [Deltaproteobacteria bacterium]